MQRSCAHVNSPYKESAELTRGDLYLKARLGAQALYGDTEGRRIEKEHR